MTYYRLPTLELSTRIQLSLEMLLPIPERLWGRATEKDSLGQKVASGVYFYILQVREAIPNIGVREFRAMRKMVILK